MIDLIYIKWDVKCLQSVHEGHSQPQHERINMFFTNLVKSFDEDFNGTIRDKNEFVEYCKRFLDNLSPYYNTDFPLWVVLIGIDKRIMSNIEIFIEDKFLTTEDIGVLLECYKHGVKHFYHYQFKHIVDFYYNYSKMDIYPKLKQYVYDCSNLPDMYDVEYIGLKELYSIDINMFKHMFEQSFHDNYHPLPLTTHLFKQKRKLPIGIVQVLETFYNSTEDINVKIATSCILEKDELIDFSNFEIDESEFVYIKGSFHHMKKILSSVDLAIYYKCFSFYDFIDSANMLQYLFDTNNTEFKDGRRLTTMLSHSEIIKREYSEPSVKQTRKIVTKNEMLTITLFKKVVSSNNGLVQRCDMENQMYKYILNNTTGWEQFKLECKPEPKNLV